MKHVEDTFSGLEDLEIYYQSWVPEGDLRAILIIVHGFGEHSGRYMNVINTLIPENIAIYALDHRGHGKSEGKENYINHFSDYFADLETFEKMVLDEHPETPIFMLGHSMGSLIAAHYMANNDHQDRYNSLILSGTGADFGPGINGLTLFLARVLSVIAPKLMIPSNLDPNFISRDQEVVDTYINDPLVHFDKISSRLAREMMKHTASMKTAASKITIPTLIQIGSEDDTFAPDSRKPLLDALNTEEKELKVYEGYRHEVYNEIDKEKVLEDLKGWINKFI